MKRKYLRHPHDSELDVIEHLSELTQHSELIDEIKTTADKLAADKATAWGPEDPQSRSARTALRFLKCLLRIVAIAKSQFLDRLGHNEMDPIWQQAVFCGKRMAEEGWMVVTGAGGGIMEAAHQGSGRDMAMGLNILLPFEQEANPIISGDPKLVNLKYFFTRKLLFVKEVHAVISCPGGFGTQDEAFETLTLVQTGKRDLMPIVFLDKPGGTYWKSWLEFVTTELMSENMIAPSDMSLFKVTDDVEQAVEEVLGFYSVYNSMRFVRDRLVLRLHSEPDDALVERLNDEFSDVVESGQIEKATVHRLEADESYLRDFPRLSFVFNRKAVGRLRQLVNVLNESLGPNDE